MRNFVDSTHLLFFSWIIEPEVKNAKGKRRLWLWCFSLLASRFLFLVSCFSLLISRFSLLVSHFSLNDTQFLPVSELSCVVLEQYCLSCHFRVLIFTLSQAGFQSGPPSSEIVQHSMRVCILIGSWMESEKVRSCRVFKKKFNFNLIFYFILFF